MSKSMNKKGFTLIELAVASMLLAVVGLAIVSTFTGGLKVYYRLRDNVSARTEILMSLDRMERDLKNTYTDRKIFFHGEPKKIAFPAVLTLRGPGRATYYYDDYKKALFKKEEDYARVVSEVSARDQDIKMLAAISDIEFSYYYYDENTKMYGWKSSWTEDSVAKKKNDEKTSSSAKENSDLGDRGEVKRINIKTGKEEEDETFPSPIGIKIKLAYKDGEKNVAIERFVLIPLSVSKQLSELKKLKKEKEKEAEEKAKDAKAAAQ